MKFIPQVTLPRSTSFAGTTNGHFGNYGSHHGNTNIGSHLSPIYHHHTLPQVPTTPAHNLYSPPPVIPNRDPFDYNTGLVSSFSNHSQRYQTDRNRDKGLKGQILHGSLKEGDCCSQNQKFKISSRAPLINSNNSVSSPTVATTATTAKSPYSTITRSPREDGDGMTATTSQYADGGGANLDPEHQMVEFFPDYSGMVVCHCFANLIRFPRI